MFDKKLRGCVSYYCMEKKYLTRSFVSGLCINEELHNLITHLLKHDKHFYMRTKKQLQFVTCKEREK